MGNLKNENLKTEKCASLSQFISCRKFILIYYVAVILQMKDFFFACSIWRLELLIFYYTLYLRTLS